MNNPTQNFSFLASSIFIENIKSFSQKAKMKSSPEMKRIYGSFYGQVIGDALGVTCEFMDAPTTLEKIQKVKERASKSIFSCKSSSKTFMPMVGCKERDIQPGQFTDDTEMALSLARSIIAKKGYDKIDVACAYAYWLNASRPSDSGITTQNALSCNILTITDNPITPNWRNELNEEQKIKIIKQINKNVQKRNINSLSNGSLMRISPLAIAFRNESTENLRDLAKQDASLTHSHPVAGDAAATYVVAMAALLNGKSKDEAYDIALNSAETDMVREFLKDAKTHDIPVKLYEKDFSNPLRLTNSDGRTQGYLGIAFQSAFYQLLHAESFASGLEAAIARGGDTDTNGCIVGALIGARFGSDQIPKDWIKTVRNAEPCLLSYGNVRKNLNMDFLSIKDIDSLVPALANITKV